MTQPPATLDAAGIAARVPHHGAMCWLNRLVEWSDEHVVCEAINQGDADHPLRTAQGLLASAAIEYAAQAMALHGALRSEALAQAAGPVPGFLASARGVRLARWRLDDLAGPLRVEVRRLAGDTRQLLYAFTLDDAHHARIAEGRATVVLNTPLIP
jgi:predicted hotdog family 3-hydroxylacyl-ACP dehydratase